jgi:hypothetical protein
MASSCVRRPTERAGGQAQADDREPAEADAHRFEQTDGEGREAEEAVAAAIE